MSSSKPSQRSSGTRIRPPFFADAFVVFCLVFRAAGLALDGRFFTRSLSTAEVASVKASAEAHGLVHKGSSDMTTIDGDVLVVHNEEADRYDAARLRARGRKAHPDEVVDVQGSADVRETRFDASDNAGSVR